MYRHLLGAIGDTQEMKVPDFSLPRTSLGEIPKFDAGGFNTVFKSLLES